MSALHLRQFYKVTWQFSTAVNSFYVFFFRAPSFLCVILLFQFSKLRTNLMKNNICKCRNIDLVFFFGALILRRYLHIFLTPSKERFLFEVALIFVSYLNCIIFNITQRFNGKRNFQVLVTSTKASFLFLQFCKVTWQFFVPFLYKYVFYSRASSFELVIVSF